MRIWSLHPKYLDQKGLCGAWRELLGAIKSCDPAVGYSRHPQLIRFRRNTIAESRKELARYGVGLYLEGIARGYRFDFTKLVPYLDDVTLGSLDRRMVVTRGQLQYEIDHLNRKLKDRDPARATALNTAMEVETHPIFELVAGGIAEWEKIANG